MFQDADTTFKGAIINALGNSIVHAYVVVSTSKEMWNALEPNIEFLTPVVNCLSWSSFLTTK